MKRAPSEDLFRLVKALNKGEKRNFKLLASIMSTGKGKKYIELFDLIDKQDVYNEPKISKLRKDLFGRQFAVGKHYLYRMILRSLVHYRSDPSTEFGNLKEQIRVLVEKDLHALALKLIKKGYLEAQALEDFNSQNDLLQLELELTVRNPSDRQLERKLRRITDAKQAIMEQMQNLEAYRNLSIQLLLATRTRDASRDDPADHRIQGILNHPLLRDIAQARSTRAQVEFHAILRKLHGYRGDLPSAIEQGYSLLRLLESSHPLKNENIRQYYAELSDLCLDLLRSGRTEEAFARMDDFKEFRDQYPRARVDYFILYYVVYIGASIRIGEPERALSVVDLVQQEEAELEGKIPKAHTMPLHFLIAYAHLMVGQARAALTWVNKVLDEGRSGVRIDLQCEARMLNMLIHYELKNYSVVESEYHSTRRFLEKNGHYQGFEELMLRGLKALAVHAGTSRYREVLQSWILRCQKFEEEARKGHSPPAIDFGTWLQSMRSGKTMAEVKREKPGVNVLHLQAMEA